MTRRRISRHATNIGPPTITAAATYGTFWAATDAYVAAFLTVTLMAGYFLGWANHHSRNRIDPAELERIWRRNRISVADTEEPTR